MVQLKNKTSKPTRICTCEVNIQRLNGEPVEGWTSPREMRRVAQRRALWFLRRLPGMHWSRGPSENVVVGTQEQDTEEPRLPGGRLEQESRKLEQEQAWGLGNPKLSCARRYIKQKEKPLDFSYINSASQMSGFQFKGN